jgi:hypothetical protein
MWNTPKMEMKTEEDERSKPDRKKVVKKKKTSLLAALPVLEISAINYKCNVRH